MGFQGNSGAVYIQGLMASLLRLPLVVAVVGGCEFVVHECSQWLTWVTWQCLEFLLLHG